MGNFADKIKEIRRSKSSPIEFKEDYMVDNLPGMQPMTPMKTMDLLIDEQNIHNAEEFKEEKVQRSEFYLDKNGDGVKVQSELDLDLQIALRFFGLTLNSDIDGSSNNADNKLPKPKGKLSAPASYQSLTRAIAENAKLHIK